MRRVLFVDDESAVLESLQTKLRSQRNDWDMAFAPSGEAALAMMGAMPFDVIVSDFHMPDMDGATLLTRVRDAYPGVVRIVATGQRELSSALQVAPIAHQSLAKPCDATTLRVAIERACHLKALLTDESICKTVSSLGDLPSLPRTYEALARALDNPDSSLQDVARIVEQDVGISAKVLQLVNSAFFGVTHAITNIRSAVGYLGINTLKNLVLSAEVFQAFKPKKELPGFSLEKLQQHAQLTAQITSRLPLPEHLADIATVAGMLHDLGKLILAWKLSDRFQKTLQEANALHCPINQVEINHGELGHAEIGAYLLGLWGLPYAVVEAVALHHQPTRVPHYTFDAIAAVYLANLLAHELEESSAPEPHVYNLDNYKDEFEVLGITEMLSEWRLLAKEAAAKPAKA